LEPEPNDDLAPNQYALTAIRAREAWNITHGDPAVTVAVIDTGYASQHADLDPANVWRNQAEYAGLPNIDDDANGLIDDIVGWDWYEEDNTPEDGNGHGSHIMGTIVAATNNETGISGLARRVQVAPLRIFGPTGAGQISDLVAAIDYAVMQNHSIINLSLTTSTDSPALRAAVENAHAKGILVIAASGNMPVGSSFTTVQYPAFYPTTLAVAATDANDAWAPFSRYGATVDLAAPGDSILSTHLNNQYRTISGTSMATAHVSALAALLHSLRPDLSSVEIAEIMRATAVDVNSDEQPGRDNFLGTGRIDMAAALLAASSALTITTDGFGVIPTQIGQTGELRVQVTAPPATAGAARRPIHNAVLHYRMQAAPGAPANSWQRMLTDVRGEATIPVAMELPVETLELQVGTVTRTVEAAMLPPDSQLVLTTSVTNTLAGGDPISFTVQLHDAQGSLITATIPIHLAASVGRFENGQNQQGATLTAGTYSGLFQPGEIAGASLLTATVGSYAATALVGVRPARPYTITGPTTLFPEVSISANSILLEFQVEDQYGNAVIDGTQITLYANGGTLDASTLETEQGRTSVLMRLPSPQTQTIAVWVVAHAGPVEIRVDIPVVRVRIWLPALPAAHTEWRE
ncbi:MAG: S8 family peptidase, partial [Litorilinea sp.]